MHFSTALGFALNILSGAASVWPQVVVKASLEWTSFLRPQPPWACTQVRVSLGTEVLPEVRVL